MHIKKQLLFRGLNIEKEILLDGKTDDEFTHASIVEIALEEKARVFNLLSKAEKLKFSFRKGMME